MSQVQPFIDFDVDYILDQYDQTEEHYKETDQKVRPWSFGALTLSRTQVAEINNMIGKIYRSMIGVYVLGGKTTRTPGGYYRVDPDTGRQIPKMLRETNEYIHPSARSRIRLEGPGTEDEGIYECPALDPYKLRKLDETGDKRATFIWTPRSRQKKSTLHELPESPLWEMGEPSQP